MGMIYLQLAVLGPCGDTELNADISACARLQMASSSKRPPATFSRERCLTDQLGLKCASGLCSGAGRLGGACGSAGSQATGAP